MAGGFFSEHLSWRWIFYVNLPVGAVRPGLHRRRDAHHRPPARTGRLDLLGAAVLAAAVVCIVLVTLWGGTQYAWGSPTILGLIAAAVAALLVFIVVERSAQDPVLPLGLFRDRTFSVSSAAGFFVGFGLFAVIAFVPLFLQLVQGVSPTYSGVLLLPLMLAFIISGVASGVAITKTGRYKLYTVVGPLLAAVGMYLLHTTGPSSSRGLITLYMIVVGIGIGLCLQVLVLVAQNTAPADALGVVTSTVSFLRTIGGSVGVAVLGAVFSRGLTANLTGLVPPGASVDIPRASAATVSTEALAQLPAAIRTQYVEAFTQALTDVFFWTVPAFLAAALVALALRNEPMRQEGPALADTTPADAQR